MRVGGEKCVSVEIEREGDGGKNGGRRVEREREGRSQESYPRMWCLGLNI